MLAAAFIGPSVDIFEGDGRHWMAALLYGRTIVPPAVSILHQAINGLDAAVSHRFGCGLGRFGLVEQSDGLRKFRSFEHHLQGGNILWIVGRERIDLPAKQFETMMAVKTISRCLTCAGNVKRLAMTLGFDVIDVALGPPHLEPQHLGLPCPEKTKKVLDRQITLALFSESTPDKVHQRYSQTIRLSIGNLGGADLRKGVPRLIPDAIRFVEDIADVKIIDRWLALRPIINCLGHRPSARIENIQASAIDRFFLIGRPLDIKCRREGWHRNLKRPSYDKLFGTFDLLPTAPQLGIAFYPAHLPPAGSLSTPWEPTTTSGFDNRITP